MAHYSPKFKEKALRTGGIPSHFATIKSRGIEFTFRAIYRLKSDAQEAAKFYKSIHSNTRIVKRANGYWVYAGRVAYIGRRLQHGELTVWKG